MAGAYQGISLQGAGTTLTEEVLNTQYSTGVQGTARQNALGFFFGLDGTSIYELCFDEPDTVTPSISMFKSTDHGATWARIDEANAPSNAGGIAGTGINQGTIVTVCFHAQSLAAPLSLIDFDLSTDTWGAVYGTAGAPVLGGSSGPTSLAYRPGSSELVVIFPGAAGGSGLTMSVYSIGGAAWTLTQDAGANVTGLAGWNPANSTLNRWTMVSDVDGIAFVFFYYTSFDPTWSGRTFFQLLPLDNSLPAAGANGFFDFPGQGAAVNDIAATDGEIFGAPCLLPDKTTIVLPIGRTDTVARPTGGITYASCYVGTGGPNFTAWTESNIPTDPAYVVGDPGFLNVLNQAGMAFFESGTGKLYIAYLGSADTTSGTPNWSQLRLCSTTPGGADPNAWTWSAITATDYTTHPFDGFDWTFGNSLFEMGTVQDTGSKLLLGVNLFSGFDQGNFFLTPTASGGGARLFGSFIAFGSAGAMLGGTK